MDLDKARIVDREHETLMIASFGESNYRSKSIVYSSQGINIGKILLVHDITEATSDQFQISKAEMQKHFEFLDIDIAFEQTRIDNLNVESLFLAQAIASHYNNETQIIIDSNLGPRYLRSLIFDAASWILLLAQSFFKKQIFLFEALRYGGHKKTHYFSSQLVKINPQAFRIIPFVHEGVGEAEIGELSGIKQSTVNIHLRSLRRLDLIEGKTKKLRKKTVRGSMLEEIHNILEKKIDK